MADHTPNTGEEASQGISQAQAAAIYQAYQDGQQEMAGLRVLVNQLREQLQLAMPATAPSPPPEIAAPSANRPRPRLPELEKFDGNRQEWRAWRQLATDKLTWDIESMGSLSAAFAYLWARLGPKVHKMTATYLERATAKGQQDPWEFLAHLGILYEDRTIAARAISRLQSMKKGTKDSFAVWYPRFEAELADAGFDSTDDRVKISYLEKAIDDELAWACVTQTYHTYQEYVTMLFSVSGNIEKIRRREGLKGPAVRDTRPARAGPDRMDWQSAATARAGAATAGAPALPPRVNASSTGDRKRAPRVGDNEIQRRWDQRLCIRCGASGHMQRDCPLLPPERNGPTPDRQGRNRNAGQGKARVRKGQTDRTADDPPSYNEEEEDSGDDDRSGKE